MKDIRQRTYPLRLSPQVRQALKDRAKSEGISINAFVSLAVAEKLSRIEHNAYLKSLEGLSAPQTKNLIRLPDKPPNQRKD